MGFSLVIEAIIEAKVPVIGHNCMYDWLYLYNQFVGKLPDTYAQFAAEWHARFPKTYDTKVLAFNSKHFFKTSLGQVYEKCGADEKHKHNIKFVFDLKNGFSNYEGTELLSHYHEAAYDAYMTGVVFGHVLKAKEIDDLKFA
jgi:poly(A)-specific ribonuclease